jgi:hypothetical protein
VADVNHIVKIDKIIPEHKENALFGVLLAKT